jgi:hypothetical protein
MSLAKITFGVPMKQKHISTAIMLFSVFFLVFLGMRNTSLSHNHGPKQRPRAVVENVFKASVEICCEQQHLDAEFRPVIILSPCSETQSFFTLVGSDTPTPTLFFLNSRAPPSLLAGPA